MTAVITGVSFPADGRPVVKLKVSERHGLGVKNLSTTAATLAVRAAQARRRRQRQRQRHLGELPGRQRSFVGVQRDRRRREPHRPRRRQLRLPLRQGDQRRPHRRRHDVRGRQDPPPHRPALRLGQPVLAHQPGQGFRARDRRRRHADSTRASTATPAWSATPRSAPSPAAPAQFGSGEFHSGVRYDVRTCVGCHNDQRRFTSSGAPVAEPTIAADGTWTGTPPCSTARRSSTCPCSSTRSTWARS